MSDTAALGAIARHGLVEIREIRVPEGQRPGVFISGLQTHRLTGLAATAWEHGALELDAEGAAALRVAHDAAMAQTLRVELALLEATQLFEDAGVPYRALKGSALAHLAAGSPSEREFRDVDLLVPADSIDDAVRVLLAAGAERLQPELRPGFDRRFGKSVTLRLDGVEIDVHRLLCPGPFGALSYPNDLFVMRNTFEVAGRTVPTLDRTDHLLHACYHVALGQARPALTNLRDVALLARESWDLARLEETVGRWQGTPVLARAVQLVERELQVDLPAGLRSFTMSSAGRKMLEPYERPGDRFPALASATLRVLPLADRAAFALAVGLPSGAKPADRARELWAERRRLR